MLNLFARIKSITFRKVGASLILLLLLNFPLSSFEKNNNLSIQTNPDEWWISVLKKHKIDITKSHFKHFYSFGQNNFGYDNALVVGSYPVISSGIYSISESILLLKVTQEEYYIIKSKTADLELRANQITYYKGSFESFNFENTNTITKDSSELKPTKSFSFKRLLINIQTNHIVANTSSGKVTLN